MSIVSTMHSTSVVSIPWRDASFVTVWLRPAFNAVKGQHYAGAFLTCGGWPVSSQWLLLAWQQQPSMAPGRCGSNFKKMNLNLIKQNNQSGTKPNLVAKIWLPTLVTICNELPKFVANISSQIHHLVNTGPPVGTLVKWLPMKVATPANYTQFEWFITQQLEMAPSYCNCL